MISKKVFKMMTDSSSAATSATSKKANMIHKTIDEERKLANVLNAFHSGTSYKFPRAAAGNDKKKRCCNHKVFLEHPFLHCKENEDKLKCIFCLKAANDDNYKKTQ